MLKKEQLYLQKKEWLIITLPYPFAPGYSNTILCYIMQLYGVVWFSSPLRHATSEVVTTGAN
jgi:hypothetical protein